MTHEVEQNKAEETEIFSKLSNLGFNFNELSAEDTMSLSSAAISLFNTENNLSAVCEIISDPSKAYIKNIVYKNITLNNIPLFNIFQNEKQHKDEASIVKTNSILFLTGIFFFLIKSTNLMNQG